MRLMTLVLVMATAFYASTSFCQQQFPETDIRILGIVSPHEQNLQLIVPGQLLAIADAWNNTRLPELSGVSVNILNGSSAVVAGENLFVVADPAGVGLRQFQLNNLELRRLRAAYQADIVIMFTTQVSIPLQNGTQTGLALFPDFPFTGDPEEFGLDLRAQNRSYLALANPFFDPILTTAHEFAHMFGAAHGRGTQGLLPDCRAKVTPVSKWISIPFEDLSITVPAMQGVLATAVASKFDDAPATGPKTFFPLRFYSSPANPSQSDDKELGDAQHNNARCLIRFALSIANYYDNLAPPPPPRLLPPINLKQRFRCEGNGTRYEQTWDDDPRTTAVVTRYDTYVAQPIDATYTYIGSEIQRTSNGLLTGNVPARFKVSACSATACSALSTEFLELVPQCLN